MGNFGNYFIFIMAFVAIIDRFIFRRKSVDILSIGDAVVKESAIAFPVSLRVKRSWVSNAQIEYWLQDLKNPSVVISGKTRPVDASKRGEREEYLLIDTKYLEPTKWDLKVTLTNGNCRLNPLYRIFPINDCIERQFTIEKREGDWDVK
ncbi:lysis protein [Escherichia coli]|nr:lysis protein [Escherichia coli]EFH1925296.1 lysis protein [Escherichia coli]EFI9763425.1 lysis protein [Escherichia coli]EFL2771447.1 lysis protein [Escherichia coli]EHN3343107.1 lysis protein [Escherichia coli]